MCKTLSLPLEILYAIQHVKTGVTDFLICLFKIIYLFIYLFLAAPGLCCNTWDLRCDMQDL